MSDHDHLSNNTIHDLLMDIFFVDFLNLWEKDMDIGKIEKEELCFLFSIDFKEEMNLYQIFYSINEKRIEEIIHILSFATIEDFIKISLLTNEICKYYSDGDDYEYFHLKDTSNHHDNQCMTNITIEDEIDLSEESIESQKNERKRERNEISNSSKFECKICLDRDIDFAFECGHVICGICLQEIDDICPFCRRKISIIKLNF